MENGGRYTPAVAQLSLHGLGDAKVSIAPLAPKFLVPGCHSYLHYTDILIDVCDAPA